MIVPRYPWWPVTNTRISTASQYHCRLLCDERFGMRAMALHAAQSRQGKERLFVEPVVRRLRRVVLTQKAGLLLGHLGRQGMEYIGARYVRFPLENLVAEDQVVPEFRGQEFSEQPMVLVGVAAMRTEHHPRIA